MQKISTIARKQFAAAMRLKKKRMDKIKQIEDLYNNKVVQLGDNRINIPFPIMAGHIDTLMSKIDNPPSVNFKYLDMPNFGELLSSAWKQDSSAMRARWESKDRAEKKMALISGRGIGKVYASSVNNRYKSHYDVVDYHSFLTEGRRGHLEDNLYAGEKDIYKTKFSLEEGARSGLYRPVGVKMLLNSGKEQEYNSESTQNKYNRMKDLDLMPEQNAFVGQDVYSLVEWVMLYNGKRYYLVFEPATGVCIRCELLKDVFSNNKYPWVSWAVNYEEYNFWSKGAGDDILPVAEAMRLLLNEVLENNRRRNRPMRIVNPDVFDDENELMEYVPDGVVVSSQRVSGNDIITLETPEISTSINTVQFLDSFLGQKTGITPQIQGVAEKDAKVGVYYGALQQAADRIGLINKEYSQSYAEKAYNWFWGLKDHLRKDKSIEMFGKFGVHYDELKVKDLKDVGDVDDIMTSGGSREEELNEVTSQKQSKAIAELTSNPALSDKISPRWLIETTLKTSGFNQDDIDRALDIENEGNTHIIKEADEAIKRILQGKEVKVNRGANTAFVQYILDYDTNNIDFTVLDKQGNIKRIDKNKAESSQKLRDYANMHVQIALENTMRNIRNEAAKQGGVMGEPIEASNEQLNIPSPTELDRQKALARPFEDNSSPEGVQSTSQQISKSLS